MDLLQPVRISLAHTRSDFRLVVPLLTFASIFGAAPAFASRAYMGTAPAVYVEYLSIATGATVTFETINLSASADPVLHLLREDGSGGYIQVAYNDDYYGFNSRIVYQNPSATTDFVLVLRSYSLNYSGTCDLVKNGATHQLGAPVGGWFESGSLFTFAPGDQVRTMLYPGGSVAPLVAAFAGRSSMTGLALGNAIAGTSVLDISGNETYFLVGTPYVRDGASYTALRSGAAVLLFNDVSTDSDGDGLGDSLEASLGTCAAVSGCPRTPHGRDTDRDGLADGEEVLGVAGLLSSGIDDLAFSRYGASPRKKDLFLEVDYLTDVGGVVPLGENPFQWIRNNPSSTIGNWTGSLESWVDMARQPFLVAPNSHVRNPDGTNGVELHLDVGVGPILPYDERKFGNWSTGASRGLVPDFISEYTAAVDGIVSVTINGVSRSFSATQLTPEEIAINVAISSLLTGQPVSFVSLTVDSTGKATLVMEAAAPGVHFTRSISVPMGYESAVALPRESNSSLRSHYELDVRQVDAVRRGRLRYAIISGTGSGGQAAGARFVSGLSHSSFVHEFGHTLGLAHYGHSDWGNTGGTCIPHYDSIMRYTSAPYHFSSSDNGYALYAAATAETDTFGAGYDQSIFLQSPWNYSLASTNTTDWNRDNSISGSGVGWRTMALSLFNGSCGAFAMGKLKIEPGNSFVGPVDLTRFGNRLYAFWSTGSELRYKFATLGQPGNKSCTGSADPAQGDCLTWSMTYTLASTEVYRGLTAYSFNGSMFVAFNQSDGVLRVRRYSVLSNGTLSYQGGQVLGSSGDSYLSDFGPELVELYQGVSSRVLGLLYLARDGKFRSWGWNGSSWTFQSYLLDTYGNSITGGESPVAKAWPDSGVTGWLASEKRTLAILPSTGTLTRLYILDYSTNRWQLTGVGANTSTTGKPFLEYRTVRDTTGSPTADFRGHFMIGRMYHSSDWGDRAIFRSSTTVSRTNPPSVGTLGVIDAGDFLQNTWATTTVGCNASLYSDSTLDNVFGLVPLDVEGKDEGLFFYPHADGSPDAVYSVFSDFRVWEDFVCTTIGNVRAFDCGTVNVLD